MEMQAVVNEHTTGDVAVLKDQIRKLKEELFRIRGTAQGLSPLRNSLQASGTMLLADALRSPVGSFDLTRSLVGKESPGQMTKMRSLEIVLAGTIRREQAAQTLLRKKDAEIEELSRMVKLREGDADCCRMVLKIRDDKIRRLEAVADGLIKNADAYLQEENESFQEELALLRRKLDNHPEVAKFAVENMQLLEQLSRYREICDLGECERLRAEIGDLVEQVASLLESNRRSSLIYGKFGVDSQLDPSRSFISGTQKGDASKFEVEALQELSECQRSLESALEANARMARQVDEMQEEILSLRETRAMMEARITALKAKSRESIGITLREAHTPSAEVEKLLAQLAEADESVKEEVEERSRAEEDLRNTVNELRQLRKELKDTKTHIVNTDNLLERLSESEQMLASSKAETAKAIEQLEQLEMEKTAMDQSYKIEIAQLMESMDCREQEFARREAELSKEAQELHVRVGLLEDDHVTMREFEEMHSVKASNMDIPGGEETSKRDHIAEELTLLVPQLEKEKAELEARRDELEMEIANLVELQRKERELRVMTEKERDDRVVEVEELKSAMSEKGSVIVALMTKLEGNAKAMVARQEEVDGLQVRIEEMEEERKIVDEELKVLKEEMAKERSLQELNSPKDMEIAVREARMKLEEERKARHAAEIGRDELALELSSLQKDMEEAQNTIKMLMTEQSLFMAEQFSPRILGDRMGRRVSCGMPMHSQRNELREAKAEAREAEERESFLRNELRRTLQLLEVKEKEIGQIQGCDKDSERDLCGFVSETHGRMSSLEGQKQIAGGKGRLQADVSAFMQEKAKDEVKIAVKETQTDPLLSQEKIAENLEVLQMELERARESAAMAEARAEDACKSKLSAELEVEWLTDQMRNAEQKLADEERSKKNLRSVIFHLRALCNDGDDPVSAEDQDDDAVWLVEMVREKMDRLKNEVAIMSQKKQDWEIYEERKKNELEALMARICALQTDLVDVELRASLAEDLARREQARASKLEEEVAKADVWKVSLDAHVEEIDHMRLSVKEDGEEKKSGWKGLAHSLSKIGKKDKSFEKLKVMIVSAKQEARRVEEIKEKEVKAAIQRAETAEREMAIAHASKKKKEIELQVLLSQVEDLRSELRKKVSEICVLRNASNDSSSLGPSCLKSEESSISEKLHSLEEELETERRKTGVLEMELDEMRATALDAELVRREAEAMVGREKALKGELVAKTKRIEELELEMVDLRAVVGEIEEISLDQEKMVEREKALEEKLESKCRRVEELEHILAAKEEGRRNDQNQLGNWGKLLMELTDTQEERNRAMADREALRRELEVVTAQAKEREFIAMEAQEMAKQCKQAADKKEAELKAALQLQEELQARATALDLQVNKLKACQTLQRGGQEQCLSRRQTLSRGTQDQERTMPSQDIDKSLARVLFSTSPVSANTSARPVNCDEDPRTLFVQLQETTSLATKLQKENYDLRKRLVESEGMTHDVVRDLLGIGRESSANSLVGMTKKLSPPPVSSRTLSTPSTAVRQTPSTAQFQPVPSSLIKAGQEKVRRLSMEARIKDEELAQVRARLDEFILERERWLEELSHQRTEACAAHVSSDKLRQTNHLLTAQNEKLKIQEANLQKRIASLEAEVRKLSGQQNLHQRIHHHVKIKEENQILKTRVEDLELKSRKESMYLQRALEELAKHRTAQGKPPGLNIDEEQRLRSKVEELEDEKHQIAKNLTNVCLAIFRASKASVTGVPSPHGAIEALSLIHI
ncbi:hypothetical protein CBR_g36 [Chara braunii]|uniref:Uncharacterized protein n=1 Tax=Chara braunii TaxID=69332 RepID=A0A388JLE2_CHABU|nr:hypothetical protein CBR_g36 [Chara braunii]|eukprot:GBG58637.1 hypothetical protein CBR_g36 [Chara braunii]